MFSCFYMAGIRISTPASFILKGAAETHYTMAISVTASTAIEVSFILSTFIFAFSST